MAHNGNLTNARQLGNELYQSDLRHLNTESDSEVLLNIFAHELHRVTSFSPRAEDVFAAVASLHKRVVGAYAVVAMIAGYGIVGFRDPYAIRPILVGERRGRTGTEYMVASESVALDVLGFTRARDLEPGEAVWIRPGRPIEFRQCAHNPEYRPCIFEHVYLARPDSIIDGISVYQARLRMGEMLARRIRALHPDDRIDVVMPIPDTATTSATALSHLLGVSYREGFIKNRYIGRTFIMPAQQERQHSVRRKLNPIESEFRDRNVLLVDDSIVRGTTSRQIVQLARRAGASKVFFASAAPPVRHPNVYGIDMPSTAELVAHARRQDEVAAFLGADWLVYQDLADLVAATRGDSRRVTSFETSIFDGCYVTPGIDQAYLENLGRERKDDAKHRRTRMYGREDVIDLHNQET
jgi:amidophosphoribosyltransferase